MIDNDFLTLLIRLTVGITFVYASYYKVVDPGAFARSIWYYHMVPGTLINFMALILPWIELLAGLAIIFGIQYRGGVLLVNLLTIIFIAALSSAIYRGISIDCGCFKASEASAGSAWRSLWFDIGLIVLCLQLAFSRSRRWMVSGARA